MISIDAALEIVLRDAPPPRREDVPILEALGRALAEPIVAPEDVPPYDNSAMDGIVVRCADTKGASADRPVILDLLGVIAAGDVADFAVGGGRAAKIMTGAKIPEGGDAVIPVEEIEYAGETARVFAPAELGSHVRPAGGDMKAGAAVFEGGEMITSAHVGVLASIGAARVSVGRRPRVAVLVTGSELADVGAPLEEGKIRNSNGPMLHAAVLSAGAEVVDLGVVPDDLGALEGAISRALSSADIVVTSGGVSVGEYDFVKEAMRRNGIEILFDKVAQKPGFPMTFGRKAEKAFFGLPGNPGSVLVCFEVYARPYIRKTAGFRKLHRPHAFGRFAGKVKKKPGRAHFVRATATPTPEGYVLRQSGEQGSNLLTPMAQGRQLALLPAEAKEAGPDQAVKFWFLDAEDV